MEEMKRNKCLGFLKHFLRPSSHQLLFSWYEESKASDAIETSRNREVEFYGLMV